MDELGVEGHTPADGRVGEIDHWRALSSEEWLQKLSRTDRRFQPSQGHSPRDLTFSPMELACGGFPSLYRVPTFRSYRNNDSSNCRVWSGRGLRGFLHEKRGSHCGF